MGEAKKIIIKPIKASDANRLCKLWHYSGKVVPNSQLHFGVFYKSHCEGVLQFGPSMDKKRMAKNMKLKPNEFLELNRMAFSEKLPKYSESRAISICIKIIRKKYPHIKIIISFADATQCGDGTIYRASGFKLINIKKNSTMLKMPDGAIVADKTLNNSNYILKGQSAGYWKRNGAKPLKGYQLKYIYCIDKKIESNYMTIPFDKIKEVGASMYKGKRVEHESNAS